MKSLHSDPVLTDTARYCSADPDTADDRHRELVTEYVSDADFWDAIGRTDSREMVNELYHAARRGDLTRVHGLISTIMLDGARDYASRQFAQEQRREEKPDLMN